MKKMKQLAKKLKKLLNKEIIDLVVFGSFAKNKINPNDIDIAAIVKERSDVKDLKKRLDEIGKIHLQIVTPGDYDKFIWITLIKEGYSIRHNKYLYEIYNIKPTVLFKYNLKKLTPSNKVMFERAIKNFKNIQKLSNRVVLVPIESSDEFRSFLRRWNIDIESSEYELLPIVKSEF